MIIEIALGIVLAVIILAILPVILAAGVVVIAVAFVVVAIILIVIAIRYDPYASAIFALLLLPIAIVQWHDKKKLKNMRKSLGYEDKSRHGN